MRNNCRPDVWMQLITSVFAVVAVMTQSVGWSQPEPKRESPLFAALASRNLAEFQRLLSMGADPNSISHDGITILAIASYAGNVKAAELLLKHNAEVNRQCRGGVTALYVACEQNQIKLVKLLLTSGAKPDISDSQGLTPLMFTVTGRNIDPALVECLVNHRADVNRHYPNGVTPLMMATSILGPNHLMVIRFLLSHGAKVNLMGINGRTALFTAASSGDLEIVKELLRAGARTDIKDTAGNTAAQRALQSKHPDIAVILKQRALANRK